MDAQKLIEKMLAQRESWVELEPGLRVRVRRPAEADFTAFREGVTVDQVAAQTVDWEGFTEATLIGGALGSSDPMPFSQAVWAEVVRDRVEWLALLANKLIELIKAHLDAKAVAAKN